MSTILAIDGGLKSYSHSKSLLDFAISEIQNNHSKVDFKYVDLSKRNIEMFRGRPFLQYSSGTIATIEMICDADMYLISTPIYNAGYSVQLKNIFDILSCSPYVKCLKNKVCGIIMFGESLYEQWIIEFSLRPLLAGKFQMYIMPRNVMVLNEQLDENGPISDLNLKDRIKDLTDRIIFTSLSLYSKNIN